MLLTSEENKATEKMPVIMAVKVIIQVVFIATFIVNVIQSHPPTCTNSRNASVADVEGSDLLGLSLDTDAKHDDVGLSLTKEESHDHVDKLGTSLISNSDKSDQFGSSIDSTFQVGLENRCIGGENMDRSLDILDCSIKSVDELGDSLLESGKDFNRSLDILDCSMKFVDELGESLHENDENFDRSLDFLDCSSKSVDELGDSLLENEILYSVDTRTEEEELMPLDSSTPVKKSHFGRVFAKTPARNIKDYVIAQVCQGKQMRKKAMDLKDIKKSLKNTCSCGKDCFKSVSLKSVSFERYLFWSKPLYLRMYWLIHAFRNSEKNGHYRHLKLENEKIVCLKAFLKILRINKNSYTFAKSLYDRNALKKQGRAFRKESESTLNAISWLEEYANNYGDRMPNSGDIILPHKSQKKAIYLRYKNEKSKFSSSFVSRSQFYKIWQTRFPQLKIRQTNPFSKCTTCFALERCEENELMTDALEAIGYQREQHHDRQMCERRYYYAKKEKSKTNPEKFMSIIIDGMDQSKTSLPHFAGRLAKTINACALLKTHITGIINHGHGGFKHMWILTSTDMTLI